LGSFYFGYDDDDATYYSEKEFRNDIVLDDGSIYFGEWVRDERSGKGVLTF